MKTRRLGRLGPEISIVGLGCNNFGGRLDRKASTEVIRRALNLGITFFDTADYYGACGGSERILGKALSRDRKHVIVATKFGMPMNTSGKCQGASQAYIFSAVEASLRRLRTDWIDLYQLHLPDPWTPLDETLRTLDDLLRHGKVRFIGCANLGAWDLGRSKLLADRLGLVAFTSSQNEYSLLTRGAESDLIPLLQTFGIGLLPYFPLASGVLTGKYPKTGRLPQDSRLARMPELAERFLTAKNRSRLDRLEKFCRRRNRSMTELAMSWLCAQPAVSCVMAGAMSGQQLEENVRAAEWVLTPEDLAEIDRCCEVEKPTRRVIDFMPNAEVFRTKDS